MTKNRDLTIDTLRGWAIFTMILANMAADALAEPHPFGIRIYGTFAAPLFVLLSGMMVGLTEKTKDHHFKYYLVRGILIVLVGAFIDLVIWRIYPFTTVDVLYLIGISIPLAYLVSKLGPTPRLILILLIFLLTPILQHLLGYTDYPHEWNFAGEQDVPIENPTAVWQHWIVDGWFPLLPWLGFSFLGVEMSQWRWQDGVIRPFKDIRFLLSGLVILIFGIVVWKMHPGALMTRASYSELFYPPTAGFIATAIGWIMVLFFLVDLKPNWGIFFPFQVYGQCSLFIYVFHYAIIEYVIAKKWPEQNLGNFLLVYLFFVLFLWGVAYLLRILKMRFPKLPWLVSFLVGD